MEVTTKTSDLNQGQKEAAEGFFDFLLSDEREMGITGPGGVGKTHLMGHMIDTIMPQYFQNCKLFGLTPEFTDVQMTATTNKAAEVLSNSAKRPTQTVQSYFNLTVWEEGGKSQLRKGRSWTVHENKILFVDEGSMIDSPLYNYIDEGTCNCKVVYVGDHCQMAPIMEPISPIYRQGMRTYNLTEPMRTQIPELHALNWQLRETVEQVTIGNKDSFKPIRIVPGIIDWCDEAAMQNEVQAAFIGIDPAARLLAYTNSTVRELNNYVRDLRQLPDHFTPGEVLVNNSAMRMVGGYMLSVEEEVTVLSVKPIMESVYIDRFDGQDIYLDVWVTDIETKLGGVFTDMKVPADRNHYEELLKWYKREAKGQRQSWSKYYELKGGYPDLRPRDASTVYKVQGSSLDTVYIDASNLSTCPNPSQAARMLYVATSRARKRVVFYGQLAPKYGGFIL